MPTDLLNEDNLNTEYSRNGHRQRMRKAYLDNGAEHMDDVQLLELYLSLVIPRRDVKELAYELMNHFGSLGQIFLAMPEQLMSVDGVGENTAVLISLFREICDRAERNKADSFKRLDGDAVTKAYCRHMLLRSVEEEILLVSLTSGLNIIKCHRITAGGSSFAGVSPKEMLAILLSDNASQVVMAHNHPGGIAEFSAADVNFTVNMLGMLRPLDIGLVDHIVVGEDGAMSMRADSNYRAFFE